MIYVLKSTLILSIYLDVASTLSVLMNYFACYAFLYFMTFMKDICKMYIVITLY